MAREDKVSQIMKTENQTKLNNSHSTHELHESGLPPAQKPSVQFALSVTLGVITIIVLAASAYYGITH